MSQDSPSPDYSAALERGLAWLLKKQSRGGGWHSETYGALRMGAALTTTAIYALSHLPQALHDKTATACAKGFAFLQAGLKKRGFVACPDGSLDYPTYSTAMLVTAARRRDFGLMPAERGKLAAWVASGQLHESREFTIKSPHYGGWDLMGASHVIGLTSDTNVSATCFALEALRGEELEELRKTMDRARQWTARCQDRDGGFWFSPESVSINQKAGWSDEEQTQPRTYASATADGLRCLIYAGAGENDKPVEQATKWLVEHPELAHVPGFDKPDDVHGWGQGLRYYYYQSLAKVMQEPPAFGTDKRRAALARHVASLQRKDGRWENESARMREDDPLIATCLALLTLAVL